MCNGEGVCAPASLEKGVVDAAPLNPFIVRIQCEVFLLDTVPFGSAAAVRPAGEKRGTKEGGVTVIGHGHDSFIDCR